MAFELTEERGRVQDRDSPVRPEVREVGIAGDDVVRVCGDGDPQERVVVLDDVDAPVGLDDRRLPTQECRESFAFSLGERKPPVAEDALELGEGVLGRQ